MTDLAGAPPAATSDADRIRKLESDLRDLRADRFNLTDALEQTWKQLQDAGSLAATRADLLKGLNAQLAAQFEVVRQAKGQAAEHLRHRRKSEELTDPLRREISIAHASINELRGELVEAGQLAEAQRLRIAGLTQKIDAADGTLAMMQAARDNAQHDKTLAYHERAAAVDARVVIEKELAAAKAELVLEVRKVGAAIALHSKTHGAPVPECAFCRALGRQA